MPPKADQPPPPPTDLQGVLKALSAEDQAQYAVALGVLLTLDAKLLPAVSARTALDECIVNACLHANANARRMHHTSHGSPAHALSLCTEPNLLDLVHWSVHMSRRTLHLQAR